LLGNGIILEIRTSIKQHTMKRLFFAAPLLFLAFTVPTWKIKTDTSTITFKIKNAGSNVSGTLGGLTGTIHFDPNDLAHSSITGSVDVNTISTENSGRDKHLKNADFFDAPTYPKMTLTSKSIKKEGTDYSMEASLTIKSTTKTVTIPFSFTEADATKGLFKSEFSIDRVEYGVGESGLIMGNTVHISLFVPVFQ
jgi:polyisoprenoid-binding protein YceI